MSRNTILPLVRSILELLSGERRSLVRTYLTSLGALAAIVLIGYFVLPAPAAEVEHPPPIDVVVVPHPPPVDLVEPPPKKVVEPPPRKLPPPTPPPAETPQHVAGTRLQYDGYEHTTEHMAAGVARLRSGQIAARGIDFSTGPGGVALRRGQNVEHVFTSWGLRMDSARTNSFVAVDGYTVDGESRGPSAANLSPRWTADLFLRFVDPTEADRVGPSALVQTEAIRCRHSDRPENAGEVCDFVGGAGRGVHELGLWVAAVTPRGTGLAIYDEEGRELGRILVQKSGNDFLGLRSEVPIASARVFAVNNRDSNFTIDDVRFSFEPR